MCKLYDVELIDGGQMVAKCPKGHRASIKCHSKRLSCSDYQPNERPKDLKLKRERELKNWEALQKQSGMSADEIAWLG